MILISGRVDQKGEGETKLVAQTIRAFTPEEGGEEERLLVRSRRRPARADPARRAAAAAGGPRRPRRRCSWTSSPTAGRRRLRLGEEFRVNPRDNGLVAELKTLFGERCLA